MTDVRCQRSEKELVRPDAVGEVDVSDIVSELLECVVGAAIEASDDSVDLVVDAADVTGAFHDLGERGGEAKECEDLLPVLRLRVGLHWALFGEFSDVSNNRRRVLHQEEVAEAGELRVLCLGDFLREGAAHLDVGDGVAVGPDELHR